MPKEKVSFNVVNFTFRSFSNHRSTSSSLSNLNSNKSFQPLAPSRRKINLSVVMGIGISRPTSLPASGTIRLSRQFTHSRTNPTKLFGKEFSSPQYGHLKSMKLSSVIMELVLDVLAVALGVIHWWKTAAEESTH